MCRVYIWSDLTTPIYVYSTTCQLLIGWISQTPCPTLAQA
jgi:hypothetical protein